MTSNEDLLKLTKVKLLEKCEELGIKKCKSKNKSDIIDLINKKINNENNDNDNDNENNDNVIKLNEYYIYDNIELLKKIDNEFIDLIYFDPPYNTGRDFYDFDDKFRNKEEYIEFMTERIKECYRVLKKTGTIVIHIEPKISHYFRFICDDIFGSNNFKNEIVWQTGGNAKNKYKLFENIFLTFSNLSLFISLKYSIFSNIIFLLYELIIFDITK